MALLLFRPRRWQPARFVRDKAAQHPELRDVVLWADAIAMAEREGISVRVRPMPAGLRGRLTRIGARAYIVVNAELSRAERTQTLVHELVHFWRDDPGTPCFFSTDGPDEEDCEHFAEVVAWAVTSPARVFLPGFRPEDYEHNSGRA